MQEIPENVVAAAVGLLSPFVPDITADKLKKAIFTRQNPTAAKRPEYTRHEAAERLGLTSRTIDTYVADGLLEARKVGRRRVLISAESVEALLYGKTRRGGAL